MESQMTTSDKMKWLVTILLTVLVLLIPTSASLTIQIKLFLAITVFNILLLAFSVVPALVPSILLPLCYWVFNVTTPDIIYKAWSSQIAWIVVGGLMFADMMSNSGLSKRIAYKCMTIARGNFVALMFIMVIPGLIIAPFVPAALARCALFAAIMMSLCEAMGYKADSPKAIIAFVVGYIVSSNAGWLFYTGSNANVAAMGYLQTVGIDVTFARFLLCNFVPELFWILGSIALIIFINRDKEKEDRTAIRAHIQKKYQELGKMTKKEMKMTILMLVAVLLLLSTSHHSLNAGQIFCFIVIIGFFPGINLISAEDIKRTNFTMVFLVTACVAIGDVATSLDAGNLLINALLPYAPKSFISLNIFICVVSFIGNFLMTPLALIASLSVPIITLAQNLGFNPEAMMYIFLLSSSAIALPYEITASMILFGYGMMSMKSFAKCFIALSIWTLLSILIFVIPWFKIIGLIS